MSVKEKNIRLHETQFYKIYNELRGRLQILLVKNVLLEKEPLLGGLYAVIHYYSRAAKYFIHEKQYNIILPMSYTHIGTFFLFFVLVGITKKLFKFEKPMNNTGF